MFDLKKVQSCLDSDGWYLEYNIDSYRCVSQRYENDFQWLGALKKLENLVNIHYKIREKEIENKIDNGSKLTKNDVDNQMCVRNNEDCLDEMDKIEIRTKALDLACSLYNTPYFNKGQDAIQVAQRFYTYITKGA